MIVYYKKNGELIAASSLPEGETELKGQGLSLALAEQEDVIAIEEKRVEIREFISSRYSQSDQLNLTGKVLFEFLTTGSVSKETMKEAASMHTFIKGVLTEFATHGVDADLTKF